MDGTGSMSEIIKFMSSELVVRSLVVAVITNLIKYALNMIPAMKDVKTNELMMGAALVVGVLLSWLVVPGAAIGQHLVNGATYMAGSVVAYNGYSNLLKLMNVQGKLPGPLQ